MNWLTKKATSFLFIKKKTVLFVLFFIFLGIFFPIKTAFAYWYDFLIGAVTFLPMVGIALVLSVAVALSASLAAFAGVLLNWVLSPGFIQWSYTRPGIPTAADPTLNPIIKIGLDITQPFVNMILILILVFIALATILRLAGYETKKLLPAFIMVALLVNFAPVICGLIIDASNIVMNYFTKEITGGQQLISMLESLKDILLSRISWETFKVTEQIPFILTLVVFIVVNLVLFLLLELFALIFMARYMVIWLLVILSPLAFVCYILPATRKIWDLWWKQFIQWSIIGITMGFFLYLADQFMTQIPEIDPEFTKGLGGDVLTPLFPLIFLALGFIFGLTTGAMGTEQVIAGFKKGTGAAGRMVAARAWGGVKSAARAVYTEGGRIRQSYQIQKGVFKDTPIRSLGTAIRGSWQRRVWPAIRRPATYVTAGRGFFSAVRDIGKAGYREAFGIKGKERPTCSRCGNYVPANARNCPHCGAGMPTCPRGHRTPPGAKFCHRCGDPIP